MRATYTRSSRTKFAFANGAASSDVGRDRQWRRVASLFALAAAMLLPFSVRAQADAEGGPITAAEWKLLPEYCIDTQGFKYGRGQSPNSAKWVALMGETFWALHHYCWGIVKFNRAQRYGTPKIIRYGFLVSALGEFRFVTNSMPENYVLAPEIYTYVGRTYLMMGDHPREADAAFALARKIRPDYWPAYSWWATYLANHGKANEARAVVTEGLAHSPQSRTLQLIMRDLDSKAYKSPAGETSAER